MILYIVSTPIGNLKDITFRAIEILKKVSVIFCEDPRITRKLMTHYDITTSLIPYHDDSLGNQQGSNSEKNLQHILTYFRTGTSCALVCDGGTPLISDPGWRLVQMCHQQGIPVTSIPGPCAFISALVISGLPTHHFIFEGFLPRNESGIKNRWKVLEFLPHTLIFYESPHRLSLFLIRAYEFFGPRNVVVVRELSKIFETVWRGTLQKTPPQDLRCQGEIVILIEGYTTPISDSKALPLMILPALEAIEHLPIAEQSRILSSHPLCSSWTRQEIYAYLSHVKHASIVSIHDFEDDENI
jgi:16S rRNA (cytidine1402-2'-O)-methyltransferase